MEIQLLKCHGSGNEFYLIDEISNDYKFTEEDRVEIAKTLCDKLTELGADGILFLLPSKVAQGKMRIFNSDGSEAEMCGNGLRCIGRYVMEGLNTNSVTIETMKAKYNISHCEDIYEGVYTVEVVIDTVDFNVSSLPLSYEEPKLLFKPLRALTDKYLFSAVSITNPHIVALVEDIDDTELTTIGVEANSNKDIFPQGVNVNFAKIIDENSIFVRTYERGVGLTPSCGTGMTASSIIASINDNSKLGKRLNIVNQGGMIRCMVNRNLQGKMSVNFMGNATYIYKCTIEYKLDSYKLISEKKSFFQEGETYQRFLEEVEDKYK